MGRISPGWQRNQNCSGDGHGWSWTPDEALLPE